MRTENSNTPADEIEHEPEEIKSERDRVGNQLSGSGAEQDTLQVYNLVKQYKKPDPNPSADNLNTSTRADRPLNDIDGKKVKKEGKKAVRGTSFGVKAGECFSLLGVNGAGKTSTFNCLVG